MKTTLPVHIFAVSFIVFTVLNLFENLIHYSIGRSQERDSLNIAFIKPSFHDIIRIIGIMVLFGVLQAGLTCYFVGC